MEQQIKILFGFDMPRYEKEVLALLKRRGYTVEHTVKLTKSSIRDFLLANPSYNTAVLLEVMNNSSDSNFAKYTADELAMLTDERDINVIVLLNDSHKGTSYMETLYTAGITSAIYQKGRHGGATPKDVVELILNKRNNRQAREYYGIGDAPINLGLLGNDTFTEYYNKLQDRAFGATLIERFVEVCRFMNQRQIADFIRRTPDEVLDELKKYEEFYVILDIIRGNGIDLKIKRPRRVQIGLSTPGSMERVRRQIGQNEGIAPVRTDAGQMSVSGEDVNRVAREPAPEAEKTEKKTPERDKPINQSFAEMLDGFWDDEENEDLSGTDDAFIYGTSDFYNDNTDLEPEMPVYGEAATDMSQSRKEAMEELSVDDFINGKKHKKKEKKAGKAGTDLAIAGGVLSAFLIVMGVIVIIL